MRSTPLCLTDNNSQCQADKSLVCYYRGGTVFICRHPCGTSVLFLWPVSRDLRVNRRRNLNANDTSVGKGATALGGQQNRAPKLLTCHSLISSVQSQAPLGAVFICDNLVRNICYGSEYFAFFNGQAGVTCKGFHPLANVKI